ncbi:MAG: potassium-transporting ATPase potassium-binding subunit [Candidatus Binatota bacterium]|nr:potassium-transporting ATPase potassium-binding subunit [Candidatus Binatota bacterium]
MTANGVLQISTVLGLVLVLVKPLGTYMARVFARERTFLDPVLLPIERVIYRSSGVRPDVEQHWTTYTVAMLLFNSIGLLFLYGMQRLQHWLPLNPRALGPISADSSFNTAVSFTSNTDWQSYVPETTMSYFVQMVGLTFHNFVSAATGIALAIALVRAFARSEGKTIGNFWVDLVRATLWVLLPASILLTPVLVWQGVPQNLNPYTVVKTVEGAEQTIAQGPVASQEVIKELGTNGGGFFNANSAHPYENPTSLTDLIEMVALLGVSAALTYTFGIMVRDTRQGWAILGAMLTILVAGVALAYWAESSGNPAFARLGVDPAGGNMEGKEVRFGVANSALWAVATTGTSCGAVNSMHDSFTPLGGLVPLVNIQLGEVVIGGTGAGLYGMLLFAVLAVFIAGLMVGRTPEYLGKKIEAKEVTMAVLAILILEFSVLGFTALASILPAGLAGPLGKGPHGFSEILYAYSSGTGNNGSAFAGISANTPFYNLTIGFAMLFGRFLMIVPTIAIAGSLVRKKLVPASSGTFPTATPLFVALLVGTILIVGGLTFFPALALGPIVDHLLMVAGKTV